MTETESLIAEVRQLRADIARLHTESRNYPGRTDCLWAPPCVA